MARRAVSHPPPPCHPRPSPIHPCPVPHNTCTLLERVPCRCASAPRSARRSSSRDMTCRTRTTCWCRPRARVSGVLLWCCWCGLGARVSGLLVQNEGNSVALCCWCRPGARACMQHADVEGQAGWVGRRAAPPCTVHTPPTWPSHSCLPSPLPPGVNVWTHGELLPAHGYPALKKRFPHLVGNYGGAWYAQQKEFAEFPGERRGSAGQTGWVWCGWRCRVGKAV